MEPEPEAAAYLQWPASARPFVMCNHTEEDGSYTHGEDAVGRVQPAQYRPTCCDCGMETVELRGAAGSETEGFTPGTIDELLQARRRTDSQLRVRRCFNPQCSRESRRAWIDLRCNGDRPGGASCKARVSTGDCVLLPQVLEAPEGAVDHVMFLGFEPGEAMMKFDPCGHTVGLESFVAGVESAFGGGSARHEIKASPMLGTFCLTCPVREPGKPCENSFVHDVHHYKICGGAAYDRIKMFGLEASGFAGGGGAAGGGGGGGGGGAPAEGIPLMDVDSVIARVVDTITDAQIVRCPYDGTVFFKDGECTHIDTCPGRLPDGSKHGRICYYCGKKWCDVDPPNSSQHREDWQTNPKVGCFTLLYTRNAFLPLGQNLTCYDVLAALYLVFTEPAPALSPWKRPGRPARLPQMAMHADAV